MKKGRQTDGEIEWDREREGMDKNPYSTSFSGSISRLILQYLYNRI